jgi:hypothetical protein
MYDEPIGQTALRIPVQAAPVFRAPTSGGAFGGGDGIEADGFWDTLKNIGSTLVQTAPEWGPVVAGLL